MQDQAPKKGEQPVTATEPKSTVAVTTKPQMPRRLMFSAGLAGLIAQACSNAKFSDGLAGKPVSRDNRSSDLPAQPGPQPAAPGDPQVKSSGDAAQNCNAVGNPQVDIPPTVVEKQVVSAFYGRQDSAMLAIVLPAGEDIKQVVIANAKGRLLALHGITGADKKSDGTWRPIVIDGLSLVDQGSALNEVVVLMQYSDSRAKAVLPINFMTKFQNKSVVDLSGRGVPTGMPAYQSVAVFAENSASFAVDTTVKYPHTTATEVRNLHTALPTTTWSVGAELKGTITDVMGTVIDRAQFNILEHQVFCTYVEMPDGKLARTMIQIG
ncbi:MAG: hypothetical protein FJ146_09795 [Deltaproteobacteria bacterium]|nr:hypothetical protein [Deltaproteobacteria bacterium]